MSYVKTIHFILLSAILVSSIGVFGQLANAKTSLISYNNKTNGYTLKYPSDWTKIESGDSELVTFIAPGRDSSSILISAFSTNATTLDESVTRTKNIMSHPVIPALGETVLSDNQTTLGGIPARVLFLSHANSLQGPSFDVIALHNGKEYDFRYSISTLEGMSPVFNMMASFHFLK